MRAVLYHLVMIAGGNILKFLNGLNTFTAQFIYRLASSISQEQANYYDTLMPQIQNLTELKLVQETLNIRDAALELDDWNTEQCQILNSLMSNLHDFHGWKKTDIDAHMVMLIESGPEGYSYDIQDEEDED